MTGKNEGARYAGSIDIGTNTVRYLLGEITPTNNFKKARLGNAITRLGAGLKNSGKLSREKIDFTISIISEFLSEMEPYKPAFISAVATSATREASNGPEFVSLLKERLGLDIEVIDCHEEARRMLLGAFWQSGVDPSSNSLVVDIGGGSTEFIISKDKKIVESHGAKLGVVHLAEEYMRSDPLGSGDLAALQAAIKSKLAAVKEQFSRNLPVQMICTAGTPTTLGAVHLKLHPYDPDRVHNLKLSRVDILKIFEELRAIPFAERKKLPWLEEGRADLILPGSQIILLAMEIFGLGQMTVSDNGLLEGILLNALAR